MPKRGRRSKASSPVGDDRAPAVEVHSRSGPSVLHPSDDSGSPRRSRSVIPVQLDKYWGDDGEDLEGWLFHVENVGLLERWTSAEQVRHAVVALAGRARTEYRSHVSTRSASDLQLPTWENFRTFLKSQFGPRNPALHWNKKLMSIKQGAIEVVSAYCSRFRRTLLQLQEASGNELPDLTVVAWFQEGLRVEFQTELERDQPINLVDAFRSAEKAERTWKRQSEGQRFSDSKSCFTVKHAPSSAARLQRMAPADPTSRDSHFSQPSASPRLAASPSADASSQLLQQLISQQSQLLHSRYKFSNTYKTKTILVALVLHRQVHCSRRLPLRTLRLVRVHFVATVGIVRSSGTE